MHCHSLDLARHDNDTHDKMRERESEWNREREKESGCDRERVGVGVIKIEKQRERVCVTYPHKIRPSTKVKLIQIIPIHTASHTSPGCSSRCIIKLAQ